MPSAPTGPGWVRLARRILRHPADRTEGPERGGFEHLAEYGSFLASSPFFLAVCLLVIVAWIVGLIVGASDRIETAGAGVISALTLGLVALLKNAELRSERAIQRKLEAIATSLLHAKRGGDQRAPNAISRRQSAFTKRSEDRLAGDAAMSGYVAEQVLTAVAATALITDG